MVARREDEEERARRLWRRVAGEVAGLPEGPGRVVVRRRRGGRAATGGRGVRFEVESYGEHRDGWAGKAGEKALSRIHRGEWPVDLRLDLHGRHAEGAREDVREALRRALRAGMTGVLIVHGRGLRSGEGAVLKEAVPGWLAEPPHGSRVLAFSSAGPHGGRGGATLVALRG